MGYRASTGVNLINDFYNCYVDVLVASGGRAPRHVGGWVGVVKGLLDEEGAIIKGKKIGLNLPQAWACCATHTHSHTCKLTLTWSEKKARGFWDLGKSRVGA